ncbi:hypothetical protein [Urbifossiella limnaea]|uniref:hypothetical protein n=1 Tax=Urbifossiella limnaea TaxID=2528023 RepID=UPI0011A7594E|nr:hypothetical protein [Urbifossiella limnaea]
MFRWLVDRGGLKPMTDSELVLVTRQQQYSDTVVIVFGSWNSNAGWQPQPGGQPISTWVSNASQFGGAVLVANDTFQSVSFGGRQPVQFSGQRVITPQPGVGEWLVLNRNEIEQFAVPAVRPPGAAGPEWELLGGDRPLPRVVTELPGTLSNLKGSGLTPLAGFPWNAQFRNTRALVSGTSDAFIAGASRHPQTGRPCRLIAVADHAVYLNGQLLAAEGGVATDNLEFADRTVKFLTGGNGDEKRTKCLLVVDGVVVRDYGELNQLLRPPPPPLPKPDWEKLQPKLVDLGNQLIDKFQENDFLNRAVVGKNPDEPRSQLRTLLGLLLTAACLWAAMSLVRRVLGAREPTDLNAAPPGGRPPPPPGGAAGVFGRRSKELATRDNLLEPARAACRDFFDTVGRPPEPGPRLPKVVITDVVRKPETLRQALRDLWAVAFGRPAPVTAVRWAALEPLLARALAAHREKKWRFVEAEAWPDVSTRSRGEA